MSGATFSSDQEQIFRSQRLYLPPTNGPIILNLLIDCYPIYIPSGNNKTPLDTISYFLVEVATNADHKDRSRTERDESEVEEEAADVNVGAKV